MMFGSLLSHSGTGFELTQLPHFGKQNPLLIGGYAFCESLFCADRRQVLTGFMTSDVIFRVL